MGIEQFYKGFMTAVTQNARSNALAKMRSDNADKEILSHILSAEFANSTQLQDEFGRLNSLISKNSGDFYNAAQTKLQNSIPSAHPDLIGQAKIEHAHKLANILNNELTQNRNMQNRIRNSVANDPSAIKLVKDHYGNMSDHEAKEKLNALVNLYLITLRDEIIFQQNLMYENMIKELRQQELSGLADQRKQKIIGDLLGKDADVVVVNGKEFRIPAGSYQQGHMFATLTIRVSRQTTHEGERDIFEFNPRAPESRQQFIDMIFANQTPGYRVTVTLGMDLAHTNPENEGHSMKNSPNLQEYAFDLLMRAEGFKSKPPFSNTANLESLESKLFHVDPVTGHKTPKDPKNLGHSLLKALDECDYFGNDNVNIEIKDYLPTRQVQEEIENVKKGRSLLLEYKELLRANPHIAMAAGRKRGRDEAIPPAQPPLTYKSRL